MAARHASINSPPVEYVVFKAREGRSYSYRDEQQWTSTKENSVIHTISIGALLFFVTCWELRSMGRVDFVLTGMKLLGVALLCMLAMIPNQSKHISPVSRKIKLLFIYSFSWIVFLDFGWGFWTSHVKPKMNTYPHDGTCIEKKTQGPDEIMLQSRFEIAMGDLFLLDDARFRHILSLLPEKNIDAIAIKADATFPSAEIPTNRLVLSMDTGQEEDTSVNEIMLQSRFEIAMEDHLLDDARFRHILSLLHEKTIGPIATKADATFLSIEIPTNPLELSMDTGLHEDTSVKKATTQSQEIIHEWRLENWIRRNVLNEASAAEIQVSKALGISDGIANEADDNDIPSLKIQASCAKPRTDMSNTRNFFFPDYNEVPSSTLSMRMSELLRLIELHYIAGDNSMIFIPIAV
jgi:uncharacterized membrane protein (Fun14 family)